MANEPERPIEKLLRDAAKKRADEAGEPVSLHPANRRVLQGEVARKFAKGKPAEESFFASLPRLWPRLLVGAALLSGLAVMAWLILPRPGNTRGELSLASNEAAPAAAPMVDDSAASTPPTPDDAILSPEAKNQPAPTLDSKVAEVRDQEVSKSFSPPVATAARQSAAMPKSALKEKESSTDAGAMPAPNFSAGEKYKDLDSGKSSKKDSSVPAEGGTSRYYAFNVDKAATPGASSAVAPGSSGAGLAGKMESQSAAPRQAPMDTLAFKREDLPAPESSPATPALASALGHAVRSAMPLTNAIKSPPSAQVQQYARLSTAATEALNGQDRRAQEVVTGISGVATETVLTSFQVEQDGGTLRIIDADGSVYTGYVQPATGANRHRGIAQSTAPARALKSPADEAASTRAAGVASTAGEAISIQNYTFSVTGTNVTLHQKVIFKGNLTTPNNLSLLKIAPSGSTTVTASGGALPESLAGKPLLNSRISGTATVGGGKEVPIEAAPQ